MFIFTVGMLVSIGMAIGFMALAIGFLWFWVGQWHKNTLTEHAVLLLLVVLTGVLAYFGFEGIANAWEMRACFQ